ncbi:(3S)-malyl-CoA thioesterase [Breoghania corrubedonensis]|uniref:(3S)-malyl-CoA thioesterase n=1 Tax=Breoghania corrubedonensis TaxID=665038 RepID=A0A2T5VF03_9HYPH|nr:acyl-CoA thioesterase [Breoghania corrubedonensis]PTW62320.1 (3S)-malyl-CoA thioesterase [Breoghania corrubedonensis]
MADENEAPRGELTTRTLAMPSDTNPAGDIFGGWVMSQMDIAGGLAANQISHGRVVTVAVDAMHFIRPVKVGDVLCVYTEVGKVGRTSINVEVEAWALRALSQVREKVIQAEFTYVAVDANGKPRPVTA